MDIYDISTCNSFTSLLMTPICATDFHLVSHHHFYLTIPTHHQTTIEAAETGPLISLSLLLQQKHKYAVWKAADIRKAIKERQKPVPGPPGGDDDFSLSGLPGGESDNRDFSAAQSGKHI
ncbi:hypothetical protein FXO38_36350 [Capsicum annuum]|nr:hypothetical protein FXO38_36350 [Capsicum annuum]